MTFITNLTVLAKAWKYINLFNPKSFRTALEKGAGYKHLDLWHKGLKRQQVWK